MAYLRRVLALLLLGISVGLAADSLMEATVEDFYSSDRAFRLRLDPRPAGLRITLAKRGVSPVYVSQWSTTAFRPPMFPTAGFVTTDGRFAAVVVGYLPRSATHSAVGIFGPTGSLVRSYSLADLFSAQELPRLARSVSGIPWVGSAVLIPNADTLRIVTRNPFPKPPPGTVLVPEPLVETLLFSLPTGSVSRIRNGA